MIVELGVVILSICVVGYAIYWQRKRARWARIHEENMRRLKRLKETIEGGEELRLKRLKEIEEGEG